MLSGLSVALSSAGGGGGAHDGNGTTVPAIVSGLDIDIERGYYAGRWHFPATARPWRWGRPGASRAGLRLESRGADIDGEAADDQSGTRWRFWQRGTAGRVYGWDGSEPRGGDIDGEAAMGMERIAYVDWDVHRR